MNRINFAARDKIDSSLSNRLTPIFNLKRLKEENVDYIFLSHLVFRGLFSFSRCGVRVTLVHRRHCRCLRRGTTSLTQIPNRLFFPPAYSRFFISAFVVRARLFLPCASLSTDSARSFAFPSFLRTRPSFSLFRLSYSPSHSQPDPDLRLQPGQCLNFGPFERTMAVLSRCRTILIQHRILFFL